MSEASKNENDLNILIHFHKDQKQELMFRREREFKIFTWSSSIFIALMGGLLLIVAKKADKPFPLQYNVDEKAVVSFTILLLLLISISWQNRERKFGNQNSKVITDINKLLHCFDKQYFCLLDDKKYPETLLPSKWETWGGKESIMAKERYFRGNLVTVTWLLGVLNIIIIWFLL